MGPRGNSKPGGLRGGGGDQTRFPLGLRAAGSFCAHPALLTPAGLRPGRPTSRPGPRASAAEHQAPRRGRRAGPQPQARSCRTVRNSSARESAPHPHPQLPTPTGVEDCREPRAWDSRKCQLLERHMIMTVTLMGPLLCARHCAGSSEALLSPCRRDEASHFSDEETERSNLSLGKDTPTSGVPCPHPPPPIHTTLFLDR